MFDAAPIACHVALILFSGFILHYDWAAPMKKALVPMRAATSTEKQMFSKEELEKLLKQYFGHSGFRGKQFEAIQAVLSGRDCFCLMPTGGGKSMCYQIPALAKSGIVLVISPLIALMENQVAVLKKKGIPADFISSTQDARTREKIREDLDSGKPSVKLLYVTPELVATVWFMAKLRKLYDRGLLSLIAIDEAHCISTWGHDFRPSYRKLSSLRNHLRDVPILALTATAVPKVEKDVIESLSLQQPTILRASFNRANIFYEVRYKDLLDNVYNDISNLLKSGGNVCSIVYCLERSACDDLSNHLSNNGISSAAYHAGLNNKMRSSVLDDWLSSRIQVVVATVAFGTVGFLPIHFHAPNSQEYASLPVVIWGLSAIIEPVPCRDRMGIDRQDVRIVCHYNLPKSMEAFYQESGRAGRDQLPSRSVLYYGLDDRSKMEFILRNADNKKSQSSRSSDSISKKSQADFSQMVDYCTGSGCRRKKILESFGEQVSASVCQKSCDACKHPNLVLTRLGELKCVPKFNKKDGLAPIFITSSVTAPTGSRNCKFWNREDEESSSDGDISSSDDGEDALSNLARSTMSSKSRLGEKVKALERAEELYFQKEVQKKASGLPDKKLISETLREASKKRLLDALNRAQMRLGNQLPAVEASAAFFEAECFKKYEKVGKTFYNSQIAATIRWLSSSGHQQIVDRLAASPSTAEAEIGPDFPRIAASPSSPGSVPETSENEARENVRLDRLLDPPKTGSPRDEIELPPIMSFSEFASKKRKENERDHPNASERHERKHPEKKLRQRLI